MGNENAKSPSSIDLVEAAKNLHGFICEINRNYALYKATVIKNAIQRYEQKWLPLCSRHTDKVLVAPLDIEWVWYVHMLNPEFYQRDTIAQTGTYIDHKVTSYSDRAKLLELTKDLWNKSYPGETFNIDLSDFHPTNDDSFQSALSYDLLTAVQLEMIFNYQVALPHYGDSKFLKDAVGRYWFMLDMHKLQPYAPMISYYDKSLIWHAHMAHPRMYRKETEVIFGSVLSHRFSNSVHLPGSEEWANLPYAKKLWENRGRSIAVSGGMFRGKPSIPSADRNPDRYTSYSHKVYYLQPKELRLQDLPEAKYRVVVKCEANDPTVAKTFIAYDNGLQIMKETWSKNFDFDNNEARFALRTDKFYGLSVSLYRQITPSSYESYVSTSDFPPDSQKGNRVEDFVIPLRLKFTGVLDKQVSSEPSQKHLQLNGVLHLLCRNIQAGIYILRVEKKSGAFRQCANLIDLLRSADNVIPYHIHNKQLACEYADYNVLGSLGDPAFHLRIIHCLKPSVSVIEVADFNSELVATAHVVDNGTLPHDTQLSDSQVRCSLNPHSQKAMVIRGENCDWAIVRASWQGYQRFIDPGYLLVDLYILSTSQPYRIAVHNSGPTKCIFDIDLTHIGIGKVSVDVEKALVTLPGTVAQVPELLCLGACIAILFTLTQTRHAPPRDDQGNLITYSSKPKKLYKLDLDALGFIVDAGLYCSSLPRTYENH